MKYLLLMLITIIGCKETSVPMYVCMADCIKTFTNRYMSATYSTQDRFIEQAKEYCAIQLEGKECFFVEGIGIVDKYKK